MPKRKRSNKKISGFGALKKESQSNSKQNLRNNQLKENEAMSCIQKGNLNEAEKIYLELIERETQSHIVYGNLAAIYQMKESLTKSDNKQKSVVLLEYPKKDVWAVGFATKENKGIINDKIGNELVNVFVPTTPNHTSGFLLMVPKKDLIYLDITFEQASKFIVSAGTTNIN